MFPAQPTCRLRKVDQSRQPCKYRNARPAIAVHACTTPSARRHNAAQRRNRNADEGKAQTNINKQRTSHRLPNVHTIMCPEGGTQRSRPTESLPTNSWRIAPATPCAARQPRTIESANRLNSWLDSDSTCNPKSPTRERDKRMRHTAEGHAQANRKNKFHKDLPPRQKQNEQRTI